ncbi:YqaJ domain-containing protein, partial [Aphis craccivora]
LRKIIQTRLLRLRYAVTEAVKYNRQLKTNIPYETRLMVLKSDLVNGPNHVFDDHTNCRQYFCQGTKEGEDELKRFELWEDIICARNLLTYHTESLMYNFNNNEAELYNSILAKFIGGKRINFSHKGDILIFYLGSYELRCNAAVTAYNKGANPSIFGIVCKMRDKTSRAKTVNDILFGTFTGNATTSRHPDGIIDDESLVEIKCPASAKELAPEDAIQSNKIKYCSIKDGALFLKRNDNYYYQVQGQLHISQKTYCYFCVWTPKGLMYEKIKRDDDFWKNNTEIKIKTFYLENLLPILIKENLMQ